MGVVRRVCIVMSTAVLAGLAVSGPAAASLPEGSNLSGALIDSADCSENPLNRNDDGSTERVELPFPVNFYGETHNQLWVNNNGNVTFDGPLATYTPFGLSDAGLPIIAPFFADVDTRGSGSDLVRYGWGETTYEGHRAFCVNWINVGYYGSHFDKLNSFQLLLVDRSDEDPGDFDMVFNYGTIEWETGDASGGVGGLGGESARAGYSNGTAAVGSSFEFPGSGIDGYFLDEPATGLIHRSFNSSQLGRYVYEVRDGAPPPDTYVALGDSYQSGHGTDQYFSDTEIEGTNECRRSPLAYQSLLVGEGTVPYRFDFKACSGARIHNFFVGQWNEGPQLDNLDENTALVTLGVGGNDLEFADILLRCIEDGVLVQGACEPEYDDEIVDNLLALYERDPVTNLNQLQSLYSEVRFRAWRGKAFTMGYPRWFPYDGGSDFWGRFFIDATGACSGLRVSDQLWTSQKIGQLNDAVESSAHSMGINYIDIYDAFSGHELCNEDGDDEALNGVNLSDRVESYHPNVLGHEILADVVAAELEANNALESFSSSASLTSTNEEPTSYDYSILPNETIATTVDVDAETPGISFSSAWPGSDVVMTLKSPSGRTIMRSSSDADVFHRVGPRQELYFVTDPEAGTWTVELFGADVNSDGEATSLDIYVMPVPNQEPVANFTMSQGNRTVTLDASTSFDPDGEVSNYLWEFEDGTLRTGRTVTHTYDQPGEYRVTLTVLDDGGAMGFAAADHDLIVYAYDFGGFLPPVENPPAVNQMNAGRAIPLKFSLGADEGLDIFDAGAPKVQQIDCTSGSDIGEAQLAVTAGTSSLVYDAVGDTYHFEWKTSKDW
ncbi:MAG: nidogen-like domain-containing protein, partial [Actinomycetota bacterium]